MSWDFLGDIGSFFGNLGSDIESGVNSAANWLGLDSSSSGSGAPSGDGSQSGASGTAITPTTDWFSGPSASSAPSTASPAASLAVSPTPAANIAQFLAPTSASAAGVNYTPDIGNADTALPAAGSDSAPSNGSNGTVANILNALGLGKASTADLLKGAVGAGGLAYSAIKNSGETSAQKQLEQMAAQQGAQGQQLESYLSSGKLPPGAQQYVDAETAAKKAAIRSEYARLGMTGSTAETQELNNVDQQAVTQMFQIASQLYNTGVTQTGASSQLYDLLMQADNQNNGQISSAINNFVAALSGTTPKTKEA